MQVTLKIATSLDGRIATASGESKWITGETSRGEVQKLRASHDAILVGVGTVLADDPRLTVRGIKIPSQPDRVVLDSRLRTPPDATLFEPDTGRNIVFCAEADPEKSETLRGAGGQIEQVPHAGSGGLDIGAVCKRLAALNVSRLFIEGGGQVAASFLRAGMITHVEWFRAPIVIGSEGHPAIGGLGLEQLSLAPRFVRTGVRSSGDDLWESYEIRKAE